MGSEIVLARHFAQRFPNASPETDRVELNSALAGRFLAVRLGDKGARITLSHHMFQRLRVLVGDPCRDTVDTVALLLKLWGYRVRTALTGPEVLDAAALFHPDVVLLEMALPEMDGCEVTRRLALRSDLPRPLLVAITGYSTEPYRRQAREAGFDQFLTKPVDVGALRALLASVSDMESKLSPSEGAARLSSKFWCIGHGDVVRYAGRSKREGLTQRTSTCPVGG
jgi:CheY-like chemotaxis protein